MAFTFQINDDKFNHNETLLAKAEQNRPVFFEKTVCDPLLVALSPDPVRLEGWDVEPTGQNLPDLALKKGDRIILDFQDHQVGYFSMDIHSAGSPMDAPLYLRIRFAEVAAELAHESSEYNGWISSSWIQEEYIHLDELPAHLALPRRYSFRYVEIKVLDTSPKWSAVFSNPQVVTSTSANPRFLDLYTTHDPMLDAIYKAGLKTLSDCMSDVFEDGPKRDRRLWIGDLRLQALANYASFRNQELVKRCLYLFGGMNTEEGKISANVFVKPNNVPDDTFLFDYSLFFINILKDYLDQYDDPEILQDLFPIAQDQMDLSLTYMNEQGQLVLEENYPVFVDWSNDFNKDTAGQAILIFALKDFLSLCDQTGADRHRYEEALHLAETYARTHLYNEETHLFRTGEDEYNIASQVWMVLAGVLSDQENHEVMKSAVKHLFPVHGIATPYMYHNITEALFRAGCQEEAVDLMKSYWGKMIELGADTFWEAFDPDQPSYSPYGSPIISSYCHAWSCTPVYLLKKYLVPSDPARTEVCGHAETTEQVTETLLS